jgi:ubiquinone/menaquinone biosynthesis C-methylase UbiE
MTIDFSKTRRDYARYRVPFAAELYDRLAQHGVGLPGQRLLDVGGGTGLFGTGMLQRECQVTLLDCSADLLSHASAVGVAAAAETMPLADACVDVVTAAQCWHWFDRTRAPAEILRVLKRGGAVAVIYQTYIPLPGSVAEATERLILRHRPRWRHANSTGINGQVLRDLQIAGFDEIESFSFDVSIAFTREDWRGFIRTTSPVGASMTESQVKQFDCEHETLLRDWPQTLRVPHRVFAAIARKPGGRI